MSELALIAPTPIESKELRSKIIPKPPDDLKAIYEGELHGKSVIFTHCGVGKVNAAHSTTLMLENYNVDLLILFGIAGAYGGAKIGDVVVAESESYGEEGVITKEGWKSMEFTGLPLLTNGKDYYNTFVMDRELTLFVIKTLTETGLKVKSGNFVTVSQCSGTQETGEILKLRFNAVCENMEGAAVAHICTLYGVQVVEIRGISNMIEDPINWNKSLAARHCNGAVSEVVKRLK